MPFYWCITLISKKLSNALCKWYVMLATGGYWWHGDLLLRYKRFGTTVILQSRATEGVSYCWHCWDRYSGTLSSLSWASYQIRKIAGCACAGNAGNVFPRRRFQRKPLVSDPGMHHGTCVTHVPWCMSGPLTCSDGESVPGIPGACAPAILRIWQEAHVTADFRFGCLYMKFYPQ